eukprot:TRINITY_DN200_c0_g1_i1.p1 TRINITY_DN200_c0_g1~~TRINITY_DN200_c0_g1_i1.p1  ORF type:complete len:355 (-),score=108.38 TRINITY_DN200_c0_g1_i1:999-2063(-)
MTGKEEVAAKPTENFASSEIIATKTLELKDCPVDFVTVYNDRAEVTRGVSIKEIPQGNVEVHIEGLSMNVDKDTVRVSGGKGHATILEVSVESKWSKPDQDHSQEPLLKQRDDLNAKAKVISQQLQRIEKENNWVQGYASALIDTGKDKPATSLATAAEFMSFYRDQLKGLDEQKMEAESQQKRLQEEINAVNREIGAKSVRRSEETRLVTVVLHANEKGDIELDLSYVISGAGWTPRYDCRVDAATKNLQLTYYGSIQQSTGEDWKNTRIALSTAKPSVGGQPPTLDTSRVTFKPVYQSSSYSYGGVPSGSRSAQPQVQSAAFATNALYFAQSYDESIFQVEDQVENQVEKSS